MSARMVEALARELGCLRHEPTQKRVRALVGDTLAIDSTRALLVYEPQRVVPSYAVPAADVRGELVDAETDAAPADSEGVGLRLGSLDGRRILDPSIPFSVHTTDGRPQTLRIGGEEREHVAFRPADPDLADYVVLDFDGFDAWYDEDEPVVAHPRDPFHAMEILPTSRVVRVEADGELLAESRRARLLFEGTLLPVRAYIPREDIRAALRPSARRSECAYKGDARYWSVGAHEDIAWTYEEPLRGAELIAGLVAFFNERVDLFLDGERLERPLTPWS